MNKLLKISGFIPYILIMFLNAMTDLGHKIILQNTIFKSYDSTELIILTALVNGLILLPFIFLFSPAGYLSDKYEKTNIIKYASLLAIFITVLITISYYLGMFYFAFFLTFILAAQSAIYSPAKYGLIKEMVGNENISSANAYVQTVTILSILLGAVVYSVFFEALLNNASTNPSEILQIIAPLGFLLIFASIIEFVLSLVLIKKFKSTILDNKKTFEIKKYKNLNYLKSNLSIIKKDEIIWLSILGLSVFWAISQVVIAIFGDYLKTSLDINNTVIAQGLLSLSGLGIVIGSIIASKVSKNYIELGIIPISLLGITLSLYFIPTLNSLYYLGFDLVLFGIFSGLFIVPLNSLIQFLSPNNQLGKILAGNNFMQNLFMLSFLILTASFAYFDIKTITLFYISTFIIFIAMLYTIYKLPQSLVRYMIKFLIGLKYNLSVDGLNNINANKGLLLLGNHISFLDWAILQMAYPKTIRFVMERSYYEKWYIKPFLNFFKVIPISARGSKTALLEVTKALNNGDTVALFPEGHLSRNGHLGEFQRGFEIACKDVKDAVIIPFYIKGLWESKFSHASKKIKENKNKQISVTFGKELDIHSSAKDVKKEVFNLSILSWQNYTNNLKPLQNSWLHKAKKVSNDLCMADSTGLELSGNKFITGTLMIAKSLKENLKQTQNIGLLLPTSVAGSMSNMAILTLGKTIVNLNYSSGNDSLKYAMDIADITTIISSKQFLKKLSSKGFDLENVLKHKNVIYLEDIKSNMSKLSSIFMLICVKLLPISILELLFIKNSTIEDTAAILFSSGSEGRPKGIELSHKNLMGNIKQSITLFNPNDNDIMLGTLPIFHSFGLTVTTLLPLIEGVPVVCHPDPTDGFNIGKLSAKYNATMLFATATFFRLYTRNKKINPLMFSNLRLIIAGAEKLPSNIKDDFKTKFGKDIYEGYGATETTPVASCNIPDVLMHDSWKVQKGNKENTVGLPIPGSSFKIVDPDTFEELENNEDGMILIGGTQIMKSYLKDEDKTNSVIKTIDSIRWYVTGDKGRIDDDGFLTIVDRYSRFAKVAGEMVSLGLVEKSIRDILDENNQISISAIADEKKGEKLILLLEGDIDIERLKQNIKTLELNPLFVPSEYYKVDKLPVLGTGKADFKASKNLAQELSNEK